MTMIQIQTIQAQLQTLLLPLQKKVEGGNVPESTLKALETLKAIERGIMIVDKDVKDLHADLAIKERSMIYHSLNCAKLTAMNAKNIGLLEIEKRKTAYLMKGL